MLCTVLDMRDHHVVVRSRYCTRNFTNITKNFIHDDHQVIISLGILNIRSGDRIPVGASFFAPVQTGPGAHPASYTVGTGSFPGVTRRGRGVDHPPPSSPEVKERIGL
jgi:hypothetical protein